MSKLTQIGINEIFKDVKLTDIIKLDRNVITDTRYSVAISNTIDDIDIMKEHIENEISCRVSKKILKDIISKSRYSYLNLTHNKFDTNIQEMDINATDELIEFIRASGYSKCIVNSMFSNCIQDRPAFHFNKMNNGLRTNAIYKIGIVYGVELYMDPYMEYKDHTIILLNEIKSNTELIDYRLVNEQLFTPRIMIDFNIGYICDDSLVCYVLTHKHSTNYDKYISDMRNEKIDNILND